MYRINLGNGQTTGNLQSVNAAKRQLRVHCSAAFVERYKGFGQWERVS